MPGNVEIKASIKDVDETMQKAKEISSVHIPLEQSDTFFNSVDRHCRLKLRYEKNRKTGEKTAALVAYQRPDVIGPKFSHYVIATVTEPENLENALKMSNGIQGKVEKQRDVFLVEWKSLKARVHVDVVQNLGNFIEFEVIVENDSQIAKAHEFAEYLTQHFGISDEDHIAGAYWNLLQLKAEEKKIEGTT